MPAPLPLLHSEKMETSLYLNRACPPYLSFESVFQMQNSILEGFRIGIFKAQSLLTPAITFWGLELTLANMRGKPKTLAEKMLSIERVLAKLLFTPFSLPKQAQSFQRGRVLKNIFLLSLPWL